MPSGSGVQSEFVCDPDCCNAKKKHHMQLGTRVASALAGFVAGAVAAAIILYPWMLFLGKLCDNANVLPN
jgi:hypothetical protein